MIRIGTVPYAGEKVLFRVHTGGKAWDPFIRSAPLPTFLQKPFFARQRGTSPAEIAEAADEPEIMEEPEIPVDEFEDELPF